MNYIKQLQAENEQMKQTLRNVKTDLWSLRIFLHSPKFTGVESDGGRKDWIATTDVIRWIDGVEDGLSLSLYGLSIEKLQED